jgi:Flp pilus assembly protein TadG
MMWRACAKGGRRVLRDSRGAAAVEFALILPVIVLLLFGIIEMGRAWNVRQTLTDAVREGARVAVVNNEMNPGILNTLVVNTVRGSVARAGLAAADPPLTITLTGVGAGPETPAEVVLTYKYTPLFGTWFFPDRSVPITTRSVMRNENK